MTNDQAQDRPACAPPARPIPLHTQKLPKADGETPTLNLSLFFGTSARVVMERKHKEVGPQIHDANLGNRPSNSNAVL